MGAACGRGEQHRLGDHEVVVEHVDERLEQAADAGLVNGRGRDKCVSGGDPLNRGLELLAGESGHRGACDVDREWGKLNDRRRRRCSRFVQEIEALLRDPVGEHPGRGRVADASAL
jgi:hypothetical protein